MHRGRHVITEVVYTSMSRDTNLQKYSVSHTESKLPCNDISGCINM